MLGASHVFNGQKYITHTTLPREQSAVEVLSRGQKLFFLSALFVGFVSLFLAPKITLIILIGILSTIYFADMAFSFFIVRKSLVTDQTIKISDKRISELNDRQLPVYTILCPLYKEARVLSNFLNAISTLDWPKDKLEVILLLEEDDEDTIEMARKLHPPFYVRSVIVPDSLPKTKPKACNYGLGQARGEYLVVYDAEDVPEPRQLKKSYIAFQQVSEKVKCLQAKLNFYNPNQNFLTRLFTSEYSLWFDLMLPGLQAYKTYIPLGGTSNHFRTAELRKLHGWDPFNVTEDCDLGARIFDLGYQTEMFDSTTYEEANSNIKNWLRQRSRWVKGYIQTYLVHTREPWGFIKRKGIQALVFHLVVGARATFLIINPILWLMTLSYFVLHSILGPQIESLYPTGVFYLAITSLIVGNFLYLFYYMVGCAHRGQWNLIKYVYLVPFYWFLGSISALVAFYQLVVKPYYWEKTNHGLVTNNKFINLLDFST